METVRINIILPKTLAQEVDALTAPRKRGRFIADAIRRRIREMREEEMHGAMEEGYRSNAGESRALSAEFEAADLEGWDDY